VKKRFDFFVATIVFNVLKGILIEIINSKEAHRVLVCKLNNYFFSFRFFYLIV